jgi:hypothetical protein
MLGLPSAVARARMAEFALYNHFRPLRFGAPDNGESESRI